MLSFAGGAGNAYSRLFLGFLPTHLLRPLAFFILVLLAAAIGMQLNAEIATALQLVAVVSISIPTMIYLRFTLRSVETSSRIEDADRKQWLGTAASLLLATMFTGYFPEVVIIVAGLFLPSDSLALLHVALRVAMLTNFALFAVDALTGPEIARLHTTERHEDMQLLVNRATRLRFVAALGSVAVFAVFGRWILGLFGEEFTSGFEMLMILAAAQFVQGSLAQGLCFDIADNARADRRPGTVDGSHGCCHRSCDLDLGNCHLDSATRFPSPGYKTEDFCYLIGFGSITRSAKRIAGHSFQFGH